MFINYFDMNAHPFTENPPVSWLLNDDRFDQALARLKFFRKQGNIALILGQTGIGKSSLLKLFRDSLPNNKYHPLSLHLTHVSPNSFLRMIVTELGEAPKLGKDRLFLQIIEKLTKNDMETLLMIDEGHLIPAQALTDLRLLASTEIENRIPLKIIISAQESLSPVLKRSCLSDLVNRICVRFHLKPLTKQQTFAYIDHRLTCADATHKIFEDNAKGIIHDYASGVPRQINNIATACLINAASRNVKTVDENIVNETMSEFHLP